MSNKMKEKSSYLYTHVAIHYQVLASHLKKEYSMDEMFLEQNLRIFFPSVSCNSALIPLGGNLERWERKITRSAVAKQSVRG